MKGKEVIIWGVHGESGMMGWVKGNLGRLGGRYGVKSSFLEERVKHEGSRLIFLHSLRSKCLRKVGQECGSGNERRKWRQSLFWQRSVQEFSENQTHSSLKRTIANYKGTRRPRNCQVPCRGQWLSCTRFKTFFTVSNREDACNTLECIARACVPRRMAHGISWFPIPW